ncbi:PDDEXK family nuclease [Burkholderia cepacia]|uniref:TnsA endonuclease N-terminal domain-containing protein n=1 Tax=Burkholderia cepacia TaxID=292 RepID=UPI001CF4A4FC|nr:TnsA endonuclease N-terminal domain-containing protein [Burkholderia cepacia]MCA8348510.1 TnsA endonuclease N-terminal domain-containing protein [Burkholderia cepacia]
MTVKIDRLSDLKRERYCGERRGSGDGRDYVPGLTLREMGGVGRLRRFACTRCGGRQIVLSSDLILAVFVEEHWDPATCDLKEYFPLLDFETTVQIAEVIGVRHPTLRDGSPAILTTGLLVCKHREGKYQWHAIEIVSSREESSTPAAALRIKQEYWRRLGVQARVERSDGLNSHRAKHLWNLFNVAEQVMLRGLSEAEKFAQRTILGQFSSSRDATLLRLCHRVADAHGLARADCIAAMRRLIALRLIECSLDVPVLLAQSCHSARVYTHPDVAKRCRQRFRM